MPVYTYKAKEGPQRTVEGVLDAATSTEVVTELERRGLVAVEVREGAHPRRSGHTRTGVRNRDVVVFTFQLASLTRSGVPILRALETIRNQTEHAGLRQVVEGVTRSIRDGNMLSDGMADHPRVFSALYVSMVRMGESGGVLDQVLTRLAEALDQQDEMRRRVQSALAYPLLTLCVGLLTVFVLLAFFLPRVLALFDGYDSLPLPTRILMGVSTWFDTNWYWFILGGVLLWGILKRLASNDKGRLALDTLKLRVPAIGPLLLMSDMARLSRTLALLLGAGLSIERALRLGAETLMSGVVRAEIDAVREQTVGQGAPFSEGLRRAAHVPPFVANMVAVGEEGGTLDEVLDEVASFYDRQVDRQCALALSLLEPILILTLGVMVGFIVAAMLLPVFELGTSL